VSSEQISLTQVACGYTQIAKDGIGKRWIALMDRLKVARRQQEDMPGSEPVSGKPTVRDLRGACGNVSYGGSRNPPH